MMLRALRRDRSGAVTILGAGVMTTSIACLAFAVDMGSVYFESRRLQGIADAAALSAAGNLGSAEDAARRTVSASGWDREIGTEVETGTYRPNEAIAVASRFQKGGQHRDAARVTVATDAQLFFGVAAIGRDHLRISRTATAMRTDLASFSLGSRLASLNGGIANQLLSGLTGSSVSLSVMDYNALLNADVDLFTFSRELQTALDLKAASFDDIYATEIQTGEALRVLATALDEDNLDTAAASVRKLATGVSGSTPIKLDSLVDLGPIGAQDRAAPGQSIRVNAYDLMRAMLEIAGGDRQVKLDLGASIPGVAKTTVWLAIGDRMASSPWLTVTAKGEPVVRTAQTRLYIETSLASSGLLKTLGVSAVRLPLFVELAEAEAKLSNISCKGATRSASLLVRPAIGHLSIADIKTAKLDDHKTPMVEEKALIVSAPLLTVAGKARVDLTGPGWQTVNFSSSEISARAVKTVSSGSLVQGLTGSLISGLNLTVNFAGLGIGTGAIGAAVGGLLAPVAAALDGLVNALTGLLGIHLGQADVRINGVRCGQAALVA